MKSYTELEALEPEAYLNPDNFKTGWDNNNPARQKQQYDKGLEVGAESEVVFISCNGTWGARGKDNSHTTSYEGIGYHSNTDALLRGFLDSGCKIVVYRYNKRGPTVIK